MAVTVATSLLLLGGAGLAVASPADAVSVPNRYYCNPNGGWCYQVNGAYHPEVGKVCHWKRSGMDGKPHQLFYTNCPKWEGDVP